MIATNIACYYNLSEYICIKFPFLSINQSHSYVSYSTISLEKKHRFSDKCDRSTQINDNI
jgi:hypothetical protein